MQRFSPNSQGPPYCAMQSRQISVTRSMSALARDQTVKFLTLADKFIGSAERSAEKPECISPQIERQCARAA
jgi:hypothetical protein